MSRIITISSNEEILEVDLAEEVVREISNIDFDKNKKIFTSSQNEHLIDKSIFEKAEKLYYKKLQKRREQQLEEKLKSSGYKIEKIKKDGKIKIVAKQRIYA